MTSYQVIPMGMFILGDLIPLYSPTRNFGIIISLVKLNILEDLHLLTSGESNVMTKVVLDIQPGGTYRITHIFIRT